MAAARMKCVEYWKKRETEHVRKNKKSEQAYKEEIQKTYDYMLDQIQKEINGFYAKYAKQEKITLAEAKKRVSRLDIEEYGRKVAKYVKEKDFSDQANEEMLLYNATMKINRLELLKANIGLEMVSGFDELQKYFDQTLTQQAIEEFRRQAGILGNSVQENGKMARTIVDASFHNATYSDRIWMYQDMLKAELDKLLKTGLIQGKNPRELAVHLQKRFGASREDAERLMVTELARVQTEAQKHSYLRNGFAEYTYVACGNADVCERCQALDGRHFRVQDMMPGTNAPPMHPRCHCSTAAYEDSKEYEQWLDFLDKGGTTEEWERLKNTENSVAKNSDSGIMRLPKYENAVIPKEKFTQYALNPEKDPDKAKAFEKALGYTSDKAEELIGQIYNKLPECEAKEKSDNGWGKRYEIIMDITGPNGKTAKVLTAWIDDKNTGEMRLTSAYVDKE